MTRSERFDAAFFVDVPNLPARRRMLERWLNGRLSDSAAAAARLAADTARFSGADLHSVVKRAAARAEHDGEDLQFEHISDQVERKRNRVLALYSEFDGLRSWAKVHCEPAGPDEEGNFEEA
nr:FtsH_fam: ATP-dependent metallopeptidase [uncultured bacterium]